MPAARSGNMIDPPAARLVVDYGSAFLACLSMLRTAAIVIGAAILVFVLSRGGRPGEA